MRNRSFSSGKKTGERDSASGIYVNELQLNGISDDIEICSPPERAWRIDARIRTYNRREPVGRMGMGTAAERTGVGWYADRCVGDVSAPAGRGDRADTGCVGQGAKANRRCRLAILPAWR